MFTTNNPPPPEKAVLAGLKTPDQDPVLFDADLQEMQMLCTTAGATVSEKIVQKREKPNPATYIGRGKLREVARAMSSHKCKTFVIDAELALGQVHNIEKVIKGKVIDRSQLILDIFAQHARTNEARIQVELAQMYTLYPRLTHAWTHFSQQVGGIGTRGPGEKQLEVDRRLVQKKISDLKKKLARIERSRTTQRKSRKGTFRVTLVGYTNVGKSSLLNALSGSELLVENKLFATLDTATRRTYIPGTGTVIISDTVGFLRKLPHHLVASFKSTLEVVRNANLLLIVMDASCPWNSHQLQTVNDVLDDLGAHDIQRIHVVNKMDLVDDALERKKLELAFPDAVFISAFNHENINQLKEIIKERINEYEKENSIAAIIKRKSKELTTQQNRYPA
ncbi:MAG: GTPase HflX [Chitinivibrionales bacterium]|nr:GTPase HflX [Chitinivibrionales bacterium]